MRVPALRAWLLIATIFFLVDVAPAAADILIVVDKSAQRMSVSVDGARRYVWKVSTGRSGYDTPSGSCQPFRLEADYFSKEWDDAPMPHAIFFTKVGHAIHGSYDTRELGSPVSHGCVRIAPENAALLFSLVQAEGLGRTKVIISGGSPAVVASQVGTPNPRRFRPVPARQWPYNEQAVGRYAYPPPAPWPDQGPYYGNPNDLSGW